MAGLFSSFSSTTSLTLFLEITLPCRSREKLTTFFSQLISRQVTELMKFDPQPHDPSTGEAAEAATVWLAPR